MGEDEPLLRWLKDNVRVTGIYRFLVDDDRFRTRQGRDYLIKALRIISDVGNEVREVQNKSVHKNDLEELVADYLPAFAVAASVHYDQLRKDNVTFYIEHPATVGKESALSNFYDQDAVPGNLSGKARSFGRKKEYRRELLRQAKFLAKLGFLHDTAEELRRQPEFDGVSRESAIDDVVRTYEQVNPDDKDIDLLRRGLYYLTPHREHFFLEIDEIMHERSRRFKALLLNVKVHDRGHNSQNNEDIFSLENRLNNLVKNLYVANAVKRFLVDNEPQSFAVNLPFSRRLTFDFPFIGPKLPSWYLPLLQGYNDLILHSEDECDDIISGIGRERNVYALELSKIRHPRTKVGISRSNFKKVFGMLRRSLDTALKNMSDSDFLNANDGQRTYEERFSDVQKVVGEALATGKTPSPDKLRGIMYRGIHSIYSMQVQTPFSAADKSDQFVAPAQKMAQLLIIRADAAYLMHSFQLLADDRPVYIRDFSPPAR